jgi:hypothetical protein
VQEDIHDVVMPQPGPPPDHRPPMNLSAPDKPNPGQRALARIQAELGAAVWQVTVMQEEHADQIEALERDNADLREKVRTLEAALEPFLVDGPGPEAPPSTNGSKPETTTKATAAPGKD